MTYGIVPPYGQYVQGAAVAYVNGNSVGATPKTVTVVSGYHTVNFAATYSGYTLRQMEDSNGHYYSPGASIPITSNLSVYGIYTP